MINMIHKIFHREAPRTLPDLVKPLLKDEAAIKFRMAFEKFQMISAAARKEFPQGPAQLENGLFSLVSFAGISGSLTEHLMAGIEHDFPIVINGTWQERKARMLEDAKMRVEHMLTNIRFSLACIPIPSEGLAITMYRFSETGQVSSTVVDKLGLFLDQIALDENQFVDDLEFLRSVFLSKELSSDKIRTDLARVRDAIVESVEIYIDSLAAKKLETKT